MDDRQADDEQANAREELKTALLCLEASLPRRRRRGNTMTMATMHARR
jgi:hypothetical protein